MKAQSTNSMKFIGKEYTRGEKVPLLLNDEVIIHPVPGHSQATKSYPAKITIRESNGQYEDVSGFIKVLTVKGIKGNDSFSAWMNDYLFNRLEFVKRNCKEV